MQNTLLALMFIFFSIPSLIYGQFFLSMAFFIFGLCFGFEEFLANFYTGKTVSQQMWILGENHAYKESIIIGFMMLGWCCLMIHFGVKIESWKQMLWLLLKSSLWVFVFIKFILLR